MDRSPGFGSNIPNYHRPFQTRFPFGSGPLALNLARYIHSPDHSTIGTRSPLRWALGACKHKVSGSLSLPSRGPFHLSFTVLFAIGYWVVFRLGGWSPLLPTKFLVFCGTTDLTRLRSLFAYGTLTLSRWPSHAILLSSLLTFLSSTTPKVSLPPVSPPPLSLATTRRISFDFFSSPYLDVSVQAVPLV